MRLPLISEGKSAAYSLFRCALWRVDQDFVLLILGSFAVARAHDVFSYPSAYWFEGAHRLHHSPPLNFAVGDFDVEPRIVVAAHAHL